MGPTLLRGCDKNGLSAPHPGRIIAGVARPDCLRPADAYGIVVDLLPVRCLATPPPARGVELWVSGRDRVVTCWALPAELAQRIEPLLRADPRITKVHASIYNRTA